jgi:CRISP-associated protein Cas1
MRQLLNTLYVTTPESYLSLENENVVISKDEKCVAALPLISLEGIEYFGYKGVSPALIGACAEKGISLNFYKPNGAFRARVGHRDEGRQLARRELYRAADDLARSSTAARGFILGKLVNSKRTIERARRDHPLRVDDAALAACVSELAVLIGRMSAPLVVEEIRGIEGAAAKCYFRVFDQLILANKEDFKFTGRSRRPPKDRINALLSFSYSLLANECASALEANGLDPYMGLMHCSRAGRKSLALDLMEELRSPICDRVALAAINNRVIQATHFEQRQDGGVYLTEEGRRAFLSLWQKRKIEVVTHPFLKEKLQRGLLPHVQAKLLARWLRGDIDAYPPYLWR